MGPVRRRSKEVQYDPVLKENWTLLRLRQEVSRLKLKVPKNAKRLTLVRILKSAEDSSRSNNIAETADNISDIAEEATSIYGGARSHDASVRIQQEHVVSTSTPSNEGRTLINLVSRLSSTVQSLQQNVSSLNGKVNSLLVVQPTTRQEEVAVSTFTSTGSYRGEDVNNSGNSHNLESACASLNRNTIPAAAAGSENQEARSIRTARGYSAETLPFVETISPQLRKNIISGLDINLASLLFPYYVGSGTNEMFDGDDKNYKTDPRLTRALSIGEFIQAFSIYKSVMCSAFPHRRSELDSYERDIVDMATRYPGKSFYEYHRRFSLDAAAHMCFNNIAVDWSIRNNTLFCNIFANTRPNSCNLCGSTFHTSGFCNQNSQKSRVRNDESADSYGRNRSFHLGREICNNFNGIKGGASKINVYTVKKREQWASEDRVQQPKEILDPQINFDFSVSTPIRINILSEYLIDHPDYEFKQYLIEGLRSGFHTGLMTLPSSSIICKNLKSALSNPSCVSELLHSELFFGFLRCGEFTYSSKIARQDTLLIQNINLDINFQNFTLHLNSSKCDPFREGINITIFENDIFNPVDLMKRYIQVRKNSGARPDSYLFVSDEYNNAPLSRDTFISLLRDLLFRLGYNDSKFCGHSFRIGAATSAAAAGVEDHIIQTLDDTTHGSTNDRRKRISYGIAIGVILIFICIFILVVIVKKRIRISRAEINIPSVNSIHIPLTNQAVGAVALNSSVNSIHVPFTNQAVRAAALNSSDQYYEEIDETDLDDINEYQEVQFESDSDSKDGSQGKSTQDDEGYVNPYHSLISSPQNRTYSTLNLANK
ncbi:unnamed protein product [Mytilus coruscus]|uniref:Tyr recombinase domain-containing protein n=1 Tax=Mytilus coruscus TaxID=42192 RepID=A0A6J8ATC4_MYTCO|nr:unnamed protein product [Mytilus coruscus]